MASARVFTIPELLEAILLRLPTKELLFSKQVCKAFRDAHDSKNIKKALFLLPGTALDTSDEASFPMPRFSARLATLKKHWTHEDFEVQLPSAAEHGVSFNPLLVKNFDGPRLAVCHCHELNRDRNAAFLKPLAKHINEGSSCLDMCFTQPPLRIMTKRANLDRAYGLSVPYDLKRLVQGGETFRALFEELKAFLEGECIDIEDIGFWAVGVRAVCRTYYESDVDEELSDS